MRNIEHKFTSDSADETVGSVDPWPPPLPQPRLRRSRRRRSPGSPPGRWSCPWIWGRGWIPSAARRPWRGCAPKPTCRRWWPSARGRGEDGLLAALLPGARPPGGGGGPGGGRCRRCRTAERLPLACVRRCGPRGPGAACRRPRTGASPPSRRRRNC
jgi:hypothetical protein